MRRVNSITDTIAAISTPSGIGGIGIVRISGTQAFAVADKVVRVKKGCIKDFAAFSVHHGYVVDPKTDETIDEVLVTVMRAPKSYTCEDVVEVSCHGGQAAVRQILSLMIANGARLAEPGEFTKRAFLNGRINLAQAEAVLDIIHAKTAAGLKVSESQLKGELTAKLEDVRQRLMRQYTMFETHLNFPDDAHNVEAEFDQTIIETIKELLKNSDQGRLLREGVRVALCGRPNVGKSSLLNAFLKHPRAIVSEVAGTTRDTIEESVNIEGVSVQFVDTAGVLDPRDAIEREAVRRSRDSIMQADVVLLVLDVSQDIQAEDHAVASVLPDDNVIIVLNKSDKQSVITDKEVKDLYPGAKTFSVSALSGEGLDRIEKAILEHVIHGSAATVDEIFLTNARHIESLQSALKELQGIQSSIEDNDSLEFVSERILQAIAFLDRITGRDVDEDLLDAIFSQFCIGK